MQDRGLSPHSIEHRVRVLRRFERETRADWNRVTSQQVLAWIRRQDVQASTDAKYRDWFRLFTRWRGHAVDLPRRTVPVTLLAPNALLQPDDVRALVHAVVAPRDKALLMVLWETGGRASEVLGITVGDVQFEAQLARVRLTGKTGPRYSFLLEAIPYLQVWLGFSPHLTPEESVWQGRHGRIRGSWLREWLARLGDRVLQRHVHPHLFRHSRATYLISQGMPEAIVCELMGWRVGSSIVRRYVHLSGRDVQRALLTLHGIEPAGPEPASKGLSPLKPVVCPRCSHTNPADAKYCSQCSLTLDLAEAQRILQRDEEVDAFLSWLVSHPEEVRQLRDKMRRESATPPE
jgi:integrase